MHQPWPASHSAHSYLLQSLSSPLGLSGGLDVSLVNCWGRRWPWCVCFHYFSTALPAKRAVTPLETHTCLQVPAPALINGINTPASVQFLSCTTVRMFYFSEDLYRAKLIMKHSTDLLTWRIGNYGWLNVVSECRYSKLQTTFWNCYRKLRGSTVPPDQCHHESR